METRAATRSLPARGGAKCWEDRDVSDSRFGDLPYGPAFTRMLGPLHRTFLRVNRWYTVPAIKLGLAPLHVNPFTGSWLLLRTRGRKSGLLREAPLGYAILDGCVYVTAGFGRVTHWYQNVLADPHVEVVLPSAAFAGTAEVVTERHELLRAWRALVRAMGVLGSATVCPPDASDEELIAKIGNLPLIRIRPTGIAAGPTDPGGLFWVTLIGVSCLWLFPKVRRLVRRGT
jgi:deazaflavin-dependent oxidoreductase (nitroreductase family)